MVTNVSGQQPVVSSLVFTRHILNWAMGQARGKRNVSVLVYCLQVVGRLPSQSGVKSCVWMALDLNEPSQILR